jgi:3-oxoacyl-[acyl-carrier-protein] synthase III
MRGEPAARLYTRVVGTGGYLPANVLTNQALAQRMDTSDEWIVARTGIRQRHIAADDEFVSDLALHASRAALQAASLRAEQIDLIVLATSTPDMIFPSSACLLQAKLGIKGGAAFDVQAVCSGFVYALATADALMRTGQYRYALVIGAEVFSRILDWSDRGTCVLFGDGAGAVVLARDDGTGVALSSHDGTGVAWSSDERPGILSSHLHADGSYSDILCVPGSVDRGEVYGKPFLKMDGGAVFKFAVRVLDEVGREALAANALTPEQVDWLIPHQANVRILDATAKRMGIAEEKVLVTVDRHANTSAASIPLAFDAGVRDGRIRGGQHVLMLGVGGGFTWGAVLLRM